MGTVKGILPKSNLETLMNTLLTVIKKAVDCEVIDLSAEFKERNKTFEVEMIAGEDSYR